MPVLVLDGHSRAAVESVQALGRLGLEVHVASAEPDCLAFISRFARVRLSQPNGDSDLGVWLKDLHKTVGYELILPCTELSLSALRTLPENAEVRRKCVLPSDRALDIAIDKQSTWDLASQLGIRVPASELITSLDSALPAASFPLVLKPVRSKIRIEEQVTTVIAGIIRNESDRVRWLKEWLPFTPIQQQEYISGQGVGVELLYRNGVKLWHFAHQRVHELPLTGGASSYRHSIPIDRAPLESAVRLLDALNWHGVAMVEFKVTASGEFFLMEINPRLWGSLAVSTDAGVNFPRGLLQLARDEDPGPQPRYRKYYTRDLRNDVQWMIQNARADRNDVLLLTHPVIASTLEYLRPILGSESWDHFDFHDLRVTAAIVRRTFADVLDLIRRRLAARRYTARIQRGHRQLMSSFRVSPGRRKLLFVCYGNICRSPLAEKIARARLSNWEICSAGIGGRTTAQCPPHIQKVARAAGIDLSSFQPTPLCRKQINEASLILTMDLQNYASISQLYPDAISRTTLLGLFSRPASLSIADPYLGDEGDAQSAADLIQASIEGLSQWLDTVASPSQSGIAKPHGPL